MKPKSLKHESNGLPLLPSGKYKIVKGIRTFFYKVGTGPAVVLIHGGAPGSCSSVNWKLNIGPLAAAGYTVYAFDQPGFGNSDNPTNFSIDYRVSHARAFVNALRLSRFHVIGNSQGAYIAARLALSDSRIQRVVLVSSATLSPPVSGQGRAVLKAHLRELQSYTPTKENMRAMTMRTLANPKLVTEELVQERYLMTTGKNFDAELERRSAKPPREIVNDLHKLRRRVLIFAANNDRGVTPEQTLRLFQQIPNAEFHMFKQCGHWVQWDQAERFNSIVAGFLKEEKA